MIKIYGYITWYLFPEYFMNPGHTNPHTHTFTQTQAQLELGDRLGMVEGGWGFGHHTSTQTSHGTPLRPNGFFFLLSTRLFYCVSAASQLRLCAMASSTANNVSRACWSIYCSAWTEPFCTHIERWILCTSFVRLCECVEYDAARAWLGDRL